MGKDKYYMKMCLKLAKKGEGRVSPNPLVGAIVVKDGRIIGKGYHEKFGSPHAEARAIADAGKKGNSPHGSTLYVSLEPCSHTKKKTPPCVPLIIKKGIRRVVIGAKDSNPKVKGISVLKSAGIRVKCGVLKKEAERLNEIYNKFMKTGKAFVLLKMSQTKNGKIGIKGKANVRISGKQFDAAVQSIRNKYDAILVGINTVLADDPRLTCRVKGGKNPVRIIMDSQLRTPINAKILQNARHEPVIFASSSKCSRKKEQALKKKGAAVLISGKRKASLISLVKMLPSLGIYSLLIEGGKKIAKTALEQKLVDKLCLSINDKRIAEKGAVASPVTVAVLKKLKRKEKKKMGKDTVIEGYFTLYSK